tara:strand:+ start:596 stop:1291 length:696 start_codon:yes stop_codon:yes gene_type:complete
MRLKPFFSYYGGKYYLASSYPRPNYDTIIEPFAGSAQYALYHWRKNIRLFDLDENIVMLWDYLIHVKEREILSLDLSWDCIDDSRLSSTQKILVGYWITQGSSTPKKKKSSFFYINKIDWRSRVASQLRYIRHWQIEKKSFEEIEDLKGTWFVDPPYQVAGKYYRCSKIDYPILSNWCLSRKGEIIVCENDGADWLPFQSFKDARTQKNTISKEVIYHTVQSKQLALWENL